ncbi:MAG: FHA domain-containing protein, partial [Armatimonadota bacterium]
MKRLDTVRIARAAVIGGAAGLVNFVIQEPRMRASEIAMQSGPLGRTVPGVFAEAMFSFSILGLLVSVALVLADEIGALSARRAFTRCGIALAAGAGCGAFAGIVGQAIFSFLLIGGPMALIAARTLGWAAVGGGIGVAAGLPSGSLRKCLQGLFGGLIGGAVGGLVFDAVSIPFISGTISRLIGDTAIGTCVGAAVTLVEESAKVAWVTIVLGRNEGKQFILSKPTTTIGRDELSDIPLYGDMGVAKQHAVIRTLDRRTFVFQDLGSPTGSGVNGVRVVEKHLVDGDRIQIGSFQLLFNQRSGAAFAPQPGYAPPAPQGPVQMQDQSVCPFCGGRRDPATGICACTPGASPAVGGGLGGACLVGVAGPYNQVRFLLDRDRVEIGRDPSNTIVLDRDPGVSRKHAAITRQ